MIGAYDHTSSHGSPKPSTEENDHKSWSDLPIDILSEIGDRLSYIDFIRFGAVCKSWEAAKDERRRSSLRLPCLVTNLCSAGVVWFLDLTVQRVHSFNIRPDVTNYLLSQAYLHASKHGWLLFSVSDSTIKKFFFYNPFRETIIDLPTLYMSEENKFYTTVATFTTTPVSHDCVVFAVVRSAIQTIVCTISASNFGDKRWRSIHKIRVDGVVKDVSHIDGVFYSIIQTGDYSDERFILGSFNIALEEWNIMQDIPVVLPVESRKVRLVESNKELLLAVWMKSSPTLPSSGYNIPDYWILYQFNWSRTGWSTVKSLGDRALILNPFSSIASPAVGKDSEFAGMIFNCGYMTPYISYTQSHGMSEYKHIWTPYKFFESNFNVVGYVNE